jgi:uncharacterized pyridoxamine 5'-phosphate oxidase family protein
MDKNTTTKDKSSVKIDLEKELDTKITVEEPILKENPNRFVLFPIQHSDIWECIKNKKLAFGLQRN